MKWLTSLIADRVARAEHNAAEAERSLERAKERHAEVVEVAKEARDIRRSNGFAEAIQAAFGISADDRGARRG